MFAYGNGTWRVCKQNYKAFCYIYCDFRVVNLYFIYLNEPWNAWWALCLFWISFLTFMWVVERKYRMFTDRFLINVFFNNSVTISVKQSFVFLVVGTSCSINVALAINHFEVSSIGHTYPLLLIFSWLKLWLHEQGLNSNFLIQNREVIPPKYRLRHYGRTWR